jgi:hypothetical protein
MLVNIPAPAADDKKEEKKADGKKAEDPKIKKLVEQLGSDTFDEREAAYKALDAIGEPALAALRKAVAEGDAEVRKRADDLVKKIEKRTESTRVLGATKVKFVFKETPVAEAVAKIQEQTGYQIYLHDPENKLKDRKVTLDTGETNFWDAIEQFCKKAGLAEASPQDLMRGPGGRPIPRGVPNVPAPAPKEEKKEELKKDDGKKEEGKKPAAKADETRATKEEIAKARAEADKALEEAKKAKAAADEVAKARAEAEKAAKEADEVAAKVALARLQAAGPAVMPIFPGQVGQITLIDAGDKKVKEAVDASSAVRVKALASTELFGKAQDGENLLVLQISPEPKIQWVQTMAVRIDKALDDQEQKLSATADNPGAGGGNVFPGGPGGIRPLPIRPGFGFGVHQYSLVHIKKGEKASKSLKELTGTISAQILTAPEAVITTENVLKNNGKTFKGGENGSIKILDVSKGDNGTLTVRFEMEQPTNVQPFFGGQWGGLMPGGPVPVPLPAPAPPQVDPPAKKGLNFQAAPAAPAQAAPAPAQAVQVQIQVGGNVVIAPAPGMPFLNTLNGVMLLDEKGNHLQPIVQQQVWRNNGVVQPGGKNVFEYIMVVELPKGQDNVKLVFMGRKQTTIDIPFTLKDVTLP